MTQTKLKINFPKFYPAQLDVVQEALYGKNKYITLNSGRQCGKTFCLSYISLAWAMLQPKQLVMVVSPTSTQVKKIYRQTIESLGDNIKHIIKSTKASGGDTEIVLINDSTIIYRSAESENTLRGYSPNYLCLDESAFIREDVWRTILAPSLSVQGKKVLFCSTPKGANYFKQLYYKGIDGDTGYCSFKITYHQNPYAQLDFIQEQQEILPLEIFEQEYLGIFTDQAGVFKNIDELSIHVPQTPKGQKCVIGIDIAFVNDFTVAVCLDSNGVILDYIRFNKAETPELVKNLSDFYKKWKPSKVILESNNQGLPVYGMLKQAGVYNIELFNTNATSKNDIINKLMAACAKKEIGLLNDERMKEEMKAFTYSLSKTGKITFAASHGHDDIPMAVAFAWNGKLAQQTSEIFFY